MFGSAEIGSLSQETSERQGNPQNSTYIRARQWSIAVASGDQGIAPELAHIHQNTESLVLRCRSNAHLDLSGPTKLHNKWLLNDHSWIAIQFPSYRAFYNKIGRASTDGIQRFR